MTGHNSIPTLAVLAAILWGVPIAYFTVAWLLIQLRDRRSIRRARRQSVRVVRGLGADLLADEARLRGTR